MKVYLASRYSRKQELLGYRDLIRNLGHEVTSRWLDGDYPTDGDGRSLVADEKTRARVAAEDLADVLAADLVICFTEHGKDNGRGGRHVEFGAAVAANKAIMVVGPAENVFYCLIQIQRFDTWDDLLAAHGIIDSPFGALVIKS